jgi:heme-degrading monooxygenase HmoA
MMQLAHKHLTNVEGLTFYKLMGSGKGIGFNPLPDWSTYALLTVWEEESFAKDFFTTSHLFDLYKGKASSIKCHFMTCIKSHGKWSGHNPFQICDIEKASPLPIGIITRASIKKRHLLKFWNYVPHSTKALKNNPNLIYTKGIGEIPIVQMATFSIWKNMDAIIQFAYKDQHHKKAIALTKKYDWYKEEMFSRFEIYDTRELIL